MFTFYHQNSDVFTKWVVNKLNEMVVAHKIVEIDENNSESLPNGLSADDLPVLSDGHEHWITPESITEFLEELHKDLKFSRSLTSDACIIDPENSEECL